MGKTLAEITITIIGDPLYHLTTHAVDNGQVKTGAMGQQQILQICSEDEETPEGEVIITITQQIGGEDSIKMHFIIVIRETNGIKVAGGAHMNNIIKGAQG